MATAGPRVISTAAAPFHTPCPSRLVQNQSRACTSPKPCRRSARTERRGTGTWRTRTSASSVALSANDAPSRMNAQPGPAAQISAPASAGPARRLVLAVIPIRALARCRSAGSTVPATSGDAVGMANAEAVPPSADATTTVVSDGSPPSSSTPTASCVAQRTRSARRATRRASNRSATTPPNGSRTSRGTTAAARTTASAPVEPVARSTASASAAGTTASPRAEMVRPRNSSRKEWLRSG